MFGVVYTFYTIANLIQHLGLERCELEDGGRAIFVQVVQSWARQGTKSGSSKKKGLGPKAPPRSVAPAPGSPGPSSPSLVSSFPGLACERRASPFHRLPRLSRGSAGTGGRRPVAGQRPAAPHTLPPGPRHIRTSPSALRACGLISPPLLL